MEEKNSWFVWRDDGVLPEELYDRLIKRLRDEGVIE